MLFFIHIFQFTQMKSKIHFLIFSISMYFFLTSCTESNNLVKDESLYGRTVRYEIIVSSAAESGLKNSNGLDSTDIAVMMNGYHKIEITPWTGMAIFDNLPSGFATVSINRMGYSPLNMVVDLTANNDSNKYDTQSKRSAATHVVLYPLSGNFAGVIKGRAYADLNLTNSIKEYVPAGVKLYFYPIDSNFVNLSSTKGNGKIVSHSYQKLSVSATIDANGYFTCYLPASAKGLVFVGKADDFEFNSIDAYGNEKRRIYSMKEIKIQSFCSKTIIKDVEFQ